MTTCHVFLCSCGSSVKASSNPDGIAVNFVELWRQRCLQQGHREVDATEFAQVRETLEAAS